MNQIIHKYFIDVLLLLLLALYHTATVAAVGPTTATDAGAATLAVICSGISSQRAIKKTEKGQSPSSATKALPVGPPTLQIQVHGAFLCCSVLLLLLLLLLLD